MAGRIPQQFIDDLIERADIVEVIDSYVPLRKAGANHKALCPFHEEKTPSFNVSESKQFYHCFGCSASGTVIGFIMAYSNLEFVPAVEELAGRYGLEIPREAGYQPENRRHVELHELLEQAVQFYRRQLRGQNSKAVDYLKQRGIEGQVVDDFEIGYAPPGWQNLLNALGKSEDAKTRLAEAGMIVRRDREGYYDRFRDRIMFPIRDQRKRVIGFGGRTLGDDRAKYLNSPETPLFHKSRELYGLYQARQNRKQPESFHVVEGYMDVIALAQYGVDNAVATLGTAVTKQHLEKLYRTANRLVFCFDGDEAGKKAAWRALELAIPLLKEGRQALFQFMPEGDDPDSFIRREGAERFCSEEHIKPLSDFLLENIRARTGVSTREDRARLLDLTRPYLNQLPESGLRRLLLQEVAAIGQIEETGLDNFLQAARTEPAQRQRTPRKHRQQGKTGEIGAIISRLLHNPELAMKVNDPDELSGVDIAGVDFLLELISFIHSNPEISCARILENWRGSRYETRLNELAAGFSPPEDKAFDMDKDFLDRLEKLRKAKARQARQQIAGKPLSQLSDEDKSQLRRGPQQVTKNKRLK